MTQTTVSKHWRNPIRFTPTCSR